MLRFLEGRTSERKLRLCAAHVARVVVTCPPTKTVQPVHLAWLTDPHWLEWLGAAELFADGLLTSRELRAVRQGSGGPYNFFRHVCAVESFSIEKVWVSLLGTQGEFGSPPPLEACAAIRDIVDPFHIRRICPSWVVHHEPILQLARLIYDQRTMDLLPILGDALEDAGCTDEAILRHLRRPGSHARGCWALDLILGKE